MQYDIINNSCNFSRKIVIFDCQLAVVSLELKPSAQGAQWLIGRILTQDRGVAGLNLTGGTALCP